MSARLLGVAFAAEMPSHVAKLILLKLVDEARDDGSHCFPSVGRIAGAAQCSRRHVQRILRKFEREGLIAVVAEGGSGRGDTTEYTLNIDVLAAIAKVGWTAATGVGEDDSAETGESPLAGEADQGEIAKKGDTMSPLPERATSGAEKGDIGDTKGRHDVSPNPLRDPLTTPEEREATKTEPDFRTLAAGYPGVIADDLAKAERFWNGLPAADRQAAWDRRTVLASHVEGLRRRPPLQDAIRDRLWEFLAEEPGRAPADDGKVAVKRYSRGMWALIARCDRAGISPLDVLNLVAGGGHRFDQKVAPTEAEEARLVMVAVNSPEFEAWRDYYCRRWPDIRLRFPVPDVAEFAWMPAIWPPESAEGEDYAAVAEGIGR